MAVIQMTSVVPAVPKILRGSLLVERQYSLGSCYTYVRFFCEPRGCAQWVCELGGLSEAFVHVGLKLVYGEQQIICACYDLVFSVISGSHVAPIALVPKLHR
eukprot:2140336-Amphidinium_carterae.1